MKRQDNKRHQFILVFILLLLVLLTYQAVRMLGANLKFYQAFQLEKSWEKNESLTSAKQFEQALNAINQSNVSHQGNPHYLITQGLIYEWGGISDVFDDRKQRELLLQAKQYYLKAVELRPTWPVTWATLAMLKWRLKEIDQEMIKFLEQADKYGQTTTEVNRAWLNVGFYIYNSKSTYTAQVIKGLRKHLQIRMKDKRQEIRQSTLSIVRHHKTEKLLCSWSDNYDFDKSWYDKVLCQNSTK